MQRLAATIGDECFALFATAMAMATETRDTDPASAKQHAQSLHSLCSVTLCAPCSVPVCMYVIYALCVFFSF